jgi:hypothetical protein
LKNSTSLTAFNLWFATPFQLIPFLPITAGIGLEQREQMPWQCIENNTSLTAHNFWSATPLRLISFLPITTEI